MSFLYTLNLNITSSSAPMTALYGSPNSPTIALCEQTQKAKMTRHSTSRLTEQKRTQKYLFFNLFKPESMAEKSGFHTKKPFLQLIP